MPSKSAHFSNRSFVNPLKSKSVVCIKCDSLIEIDRLSARNARTEANLSDELSELENRYNEKRTEYNNVVAEIDDKRTRAVIAEKFLKDLSEIKEPLKEWDDEVFRKLVDRVEIGGKEGIKTIFKILKLSKIIS